MVGLGHLFRIHSVNLILGYEYVESRVIFIIIIIIIIIVIIIIIIISLFLLMLRGA